MDEDLNGVEVLDFMLNVQKFAKYRCSFKKDDLHEDCIHSPYHARSQHAVKCVEHRWILVHDCP